MTTSLVFFIILAILAIASALAMILSRSAIYSALFLVLNFLAVAVIYLMMGAPFVSLAQITVYAGAIMILFIFVIMLLGTKKLDTDEPLKWQRPLAIILSAALVIEGAYALITRIGNNVLATAATTELADPKTLGMVLFQKYALPFEIVSVILLVAAIGAVVLSRHDSISGGN